MKPTLDAIAQDALETAQNLEKVTSGSASRLAYSLRQQLDDIVDGLGRMTYEYSVQVKRSAGWEYTYELWDNRWQDSYAVQEVRAQHDHPGEETRIVRRRVSQPEVINE